MQALKLFTLKNGFQLAGVSHTQNQTFLVLRTTVGSLELPLTEVQKVEVVNGSPRTGTTQKDAGANKASVQSLLDFAAISEGLPPALVRSVARMESGYNPNALSAKGALGLMQLMPATASLLGVEPSLADQNAKGGAKYLRKLLVRYKGDAVLALAAYNAGPAAVKKYGGVPPYIETRQYVERVLREYCHQK